MEKTFHSDNSSRWKPGSPTDPADQSDFYLQERQIGRQVEMTNFALKSGIHRAFPTAVFDEITFLPETGIYLYSRQVTIHIAGRHLDELYQLLVRRRVREVREFSNKEVGESELFIQSITIHSDYDRQ